MKKVHPPIFVNYFIASFYFSKCKKLLVQNNKTFNIDAKSCLHRDRLMGEQNPRSLWLTSRHSNVIMTKLIRSNFLHNGLDAVWPDG